jgi:hypothetical protein
MLSHLANLIGPSATNWLIVVVSGVLFLAAAAVLPALTRRLTGKDGHPLL